MNDRGMIKWQPFNAVVSGNSIINSVMAKKNKKDMPILSDDQLNNIQEKIFYSWETKDKIMVVYFKNGNYYKNQGYVIDIKINQKKIVFDNGLNLFFSQIIKIN